MAQVEISIMHSLPVAQSISVAPVTPEDWEIIVRAPALLPGAEPVLTGMAIQSMHADYLEQNLLLHVRVCSKGQVLEVWIKGKTRVKMRVGQPSFALNTSHHCHLMMSLLESLLPNGSTGLLLSANTEVIIAPLLRSNGSSAAPTQAIPSAPQTISQPAPPPAATTSKTVAASNSVSGPSPTLRNLPARLVPALSLKGKERASEDSQNLECWMSESSLCLLYPNLDLPKSSSAPRRVLIQTILPPYRSSQAPSSLSPAANPGAPLAPPGAPASAAEATPPPPNPPRAAVVRIEDAVPFGHVVLTNQGSADPVPDWELVKASVDLTKAAKAAPNGKARETSQEKPKPV